MLTYADGCSTFKHEWKKEDEMKRSLKARIEVARFLQVTYADGC
jgi:hypothetical protein